MLTTTADLIGFLGWGAVLLVVIPAIQRGFASLLAPMPFSKKAWKKEADKLGYRQTSLWHLEGNSGGRHVSLRYSIINLTLTATVDLDWSPDELMLKRYKELPGGHIDQQLQPFKTQDDQFDFKVAAHGNYPYPLALFSEKSRLAATELISEGGIVEQGKLVFSVSGVGRSDFLKVVEKVTRWASLLDRPEAHIAERYASNALTDSNYIVARANFLALKRMNNSHGALLWKTAEALQNHSDARMKIMVMTYMARRYSELGNQDALQKQLKTLEQALTDWKCDEVRNSLPVLTKSAEDLQRDALNTLVEFGHITGAYSMVTSPRPELATLAAEMLLKHGTNEAESALVGAIETAENQTLVAICDALATFGSIAAVEPLQAVSSKWFNAISVRRAASKAVASIQSRAAGAQAGQLFMVHDVVEDGALTLPVDTEGALTVHKEEA